MARDTRLGAIPGVGVVAERGSRAPTGVRPAETMGIGRAGGLEDHLLLHVLVRGLVGRFVRGLVGRLLRDTGWFPGRRRGGTRAGTRAVAHLGGRPPAFGLAGDLDQATENNLGRVVEGVDDETFQLLVQLIRNLERPHDLSPCNKGPIFPDTVGSKPAAL
jgi:hypothetical protein